MSRPITNVVLVHGGFVDGSGWQQVHDLLVADGFHVAVMQNPSLSLTDDAAVTRRAIETLDGPVVLVGHSYGGAVITEAGTHGQVAVPVYIAAFAPDAGESVNTGGVETTIQDGLEGLSDLLRDQRVGIVFSDLDSTLLQGREPLLSIERDWQRLVSSAAWAAGARSATSICLYETAVLQQMDSAIDTALDLFASHDDLWVTQAGATCTDRQATMRTLEALCSPGSGR